MLTCMDCGKELSGGLDTFGAVGAEVCAEHYFNPPTTADDLRVVELETELDDVEADISDLESELDDLKSRRDDLEEELKLLRPPKKAQKVILKSVSA